jgi:hypothetical protein
MSALRAIPCGAVGDSDKSCCCRAPRAGTRGAQQRRALFPCIDAPQLLAAPLTLLIFATSLSMLDPDVYIYAAQHELTQCRRALGMAKAVIDAQTLN